MFERFTDRSRRVLVLAQQEAQSSASQIGPEHILVGMAAEGEGVAAVVLSAHGLGAEILRARVRQVSGRPPTDAEAASALATLGIDLDRVRAEVEASFGEGSFQLGRAYPPYSEVAKGLLEASVAEARDLGHDYVGTEHLLLASAALSEGSVSEVLRTLGVEPESIRSTTLAVLRSATQLAGSPVWAEIAALERAVATLPEPPRGEAQAVLAEEIWLVRAEAILSLRDLNGEADTDVAISRANDRLRSSLATAKGRLTELGVSAFLERIETSFVQSARRALDQVGMAVASVNTLVMGPPLSPESLGRTVRALHEYRDRREETWRRAWERSGMDDAALALDVFETCRKAGEELSAIIRQVTKELREGAVS